MRGIDLKDYKGDIDFFINSRVPNCMVYNKLGVVLQDKYNKREGSK